FRPCQWAGAVYTRSGLVDHQVMETLCARCQLGSELFGLPRGGSIANGDQGNAVLVDQPPQSRQRLRPAALRSMRVDGIGCQYLSRRINNRQLTASAKGRIDAEYDAICYRRLAEQAAQVSGEDVNRMPFG